MILKVLSGLFDPFSSFFAQMPPVEHRFATFGAFARTIVDDSLALRSVSPESPVPKPVASDRSSLMRNSCFPRSSRGAGTGFDGPSHRLVFVPIHEASDADSPMPVPNPESRFSSRTPLFFANPEPLGLVRREPRESYFTQGYMSRRISCGPILCAQSGRVPTVPWLRAIKFQVSNC